MTMTTTEPAQPGPANAPHGVAESRSLFDGPILRQALVDSLTKLNPAVQIRNPVMFVVLVGSIVTFVEAIAHPSTFTWSITVWLFLTVIFANFAEAMAEGRGKAQADTLRKARSETIAKRIRQDGSIEEITGSKLRSGDRVRVIRGALAGVEGTLERTKLTSRLLISIEMIRQSLSVNVLREDVELVNANPVHPTQFGQSAATL